MTSLSSGQQRSVLSEERPSPGQDSPGGVRPRRFRSAWMLVAALLLVAVAVGLTLGLQGGNSTGGGIPAPLPGNWHLVFNADFEGNALNTALWKTCYDTGTCRIATNPEFETYVPSGVSVSNGALSLTARAEPTKGQPFSSGMVQSNGRFDFTYGYMEARAKVPGTPGTWPALWLLPQAHNKWPPEIDLMENWGSRPDEVRLSLFQPDNTAGLHKTITVPHLPAGYHTFGVDWEPGVITWYVDGHRRYVLHESVDEPMYPIANLAVTAQSSDGFEGLFPATFSVDYIRVFQHPGVGSVTCTAGCAHG